MTHELVPKRVTSTRDPRLHARPEIGPVSAVEVLHRRLGNRATCPLLQTKLRVGAPNDRYEQEADRVADIVMRSPQPGESELAASDTGPLLQRCSCGGSRASCAAHDEEHPEFTVQRVAISPVPPDRIQREATESCSVKDEALDPEEAAEEAEENAKPPAGTPIRGDRYPHELQSAPGWIGVPFGTVEPDIREGEAHAAGAMLTLHVRCWIEDQWVWFTGMPATFLDLDSLNRRRILVSRTADDFHFKLTPDAGVVYVYTKGDSATYLD